MDGYHLPDEASPDKETPMAYYDADGELIPTDDARHPDFDEEEELIIFLKRLTEHIDPGDTVLRRRTDDVPPKPRPWTEHGCPPDCDRTYSGSGHQGGWSSDHNGYCPHGTYVAGSGVDWMCGYCENGD